MNKAILMGRLTSDPEMRQTPTGVSLARFSIAINRRFAKDQTDFINCVAWRQTGEFISRYFTKGSMIAVVGSIQTRNWEGQDGKRQYATEVVVDEAYFTGSKAETGTGGGYNNGYQSNNFQQPQMFNATQPQTFNAPQTSQPPSNDMGFGDDFDDMGFEDLDGSEDDLPF